MTATCSPAQSGPTFLLFAPLLLIVLGRLALVCTSRLFLLFQGLLLRPHLLPLLGLFLLLLYESCFLLGSL